LPLLVLAERSQALGLLTFVSRPRCCAKRRKDKARSAGHSGPIAKLCNAARR
jgi:hypothetical protein